MFAQAAEVAWARARVAHCKAALVADPAQRETLYEEALREHEASSRPFERARTELAYGEFLRRHRRRVDAREHLRPALETFRRARGETMGGACACGAAGERRERAVAPGGP